MQPIFKLIQLIGILALIFGLYNLIRLNMADLTLTFELKFDVPYLWAWNSGPITLGFALFSVFMVGMALSYLIFAYEYYAQRSRLAKIKRELKQTRQIISEAMMKERLEKRGESADVKGLPVLSAETDRDFAEKFEV